MSQTFSLVFLLLLPSVVRCEPVQATNDTLVDVFPLSIGNQWTYRYYTCVVDWPSGNPGTTITDSGYVILNITGCTADADSTSWQFRVERNLTHHAIFSSLSAPDRDTIYQIRDTSYIDLIEPNKGQHQIYRNADPHLIRYDVFPFTQGYIDTTKIYRYRQVSEGDTTTLFSWINHIGVPYFQSTFTFKKGVGLIRNHYNSGTIDFTAINEHYLLSSKLTSVQQRTGAPTTASFVLSQNYPNPSNPTANFEMQIAKFGMVTFKVFDLLGREVATLVNEERPAGRYFVEWDGYRFPSGVYFARLQSGSDVLTREMLLVK